jgi:hypothetical protein
MEAEGDENIQDFVAQIQRELFRMVRLLIIMLLYVYSIIQAFKYL